MVENRQEVNITGLAKKKSEPKKKDNADRMEERVQDRQRFGTQNC